MSDDLHLVERRDVAELAATHRLAFDAPWDASAMAVLLKQDGVIGVRHADGLILCRVVADEAEILTLAVRPDARRSGLGRRLTEAAADVCMTRGAERLFLEVADDNATARALYARVGFVEVGRRRAYYSRPGGPAADALILSLNLVGRLPSR